MGKTKLNDDKATAIAVATAVSSIGEDEEGSQRHVVDWSPEEERRAKRKYDMCSYSQP